LLQLAWRLPWPGSQDGADVPWLLFCAVATVALIIAAVLLSNAST
jgi:hypothetical protein